MLLSGQPQQSPCLMQEWRYSYLYIKLNLKQRHIVESHSVYVTYFFCTVQVNVIPSLAEAYVNLRIHSAQSLQEVESNFYIFRFLSVNIQRWLRCVPSHLGPGLGPVYSSGPASKNRTCLWVWPSTCQLHWWKVLRLPDRKEDNFGLVSISRSSSRYKRVEL